MARILIVDDHALQRESLAALLCFGGHQLIEAANGEEGLRQLRQTRPHVVIAQALLPGMDGSEFVASMRNDPGVSGTPVIFCCPPCRTGDAQAMARDCGVRWVLNLPCDPQEMLCTVQQALEVDEPEPVLADAGVDASAGTAAGLGRVRPLPPQFNGYLKEAENSNELLTHVLAHANPADPLHARLQRLSERLAGSLASLETVSQRLTDLIDLGLQLGAEHDSEEMLHLASSVARKVCGADVAALAIVDDAGECLSHYLVCGVGDEAANCTPPAPTREPYAGLLATRRPLRQPVATGAGLAGAEQAFLCIPLTTAARCHGWLALAGKPAGFSESDERMAATVAAQLALAWENLVLYRELAHHHEQLRQESAVRRATDEDLRRFRAAMDVTEDAVMLIDPVKLRFLDFNAATCRMFGYSEQELKRNGPLGLTTGTPEQLRQLYGCVIRGEPHCADNEIRLQKKDGTPLPLEIHRRALRSGRDWIIVAVIRDVSEREAQRQLSRQLAHYDPVTGLVNRTHFVKTLQQKLAQAQPQEGVVLLLLDLDRFQKINDSLGHACGDELLRQVGDRLLSCLPSRDTVGRLGADEFGIILSIPEHDRQETLVLHRLRSVLAPRFAIDGKELTLTASMGVAVFPGDAADAEALLKYADTAMHRAKESGRNTWRYFTADMNRHALARLELENSLRTAIEQHQFRLFLQPRVSLATGQVCSAEVLLRWDRPGKGLVSPSHFIALLEETGLIVQVGNWVIEETCRMMDRWRQEGFEPMPLSFNVSARQFLAKSLEQTIADAVQAHHLDPTLLTLELTESSLMADVAHSSLVLANLKRLGMKVALDDFGTGYSSLAYLRRFPIDTLKIDAAFIRELSTNPEDAAIVSAVVSMAHSLKMEVVAEGVEDAGQLDYLRRNRCDEIQGNWYSPPVPEQEFRRMVSTRIPLRIH